MYRISETEFLQYEVAENRLQELRQLHAIEIQQAYDDIYPTRTSFNYGLGKIYSESVNTEDYAIYLVDLKEEYIRTERWWTLRVLAFKDAFNLLSERDQWNYRVSGLRVEARKRLREHLTSIIEMRPEIQRKIMVFAELEDLEEVDRRIDEMTEEELLEDYWDLDEANKR
jgi:hypothetical protein